MKRDILDSILLAVIVRLYFPWEFNTVFENLVIITGLSMIFLSFIEWIKELKERK